MKKYAVLGAFDRFNYGDILFPIIISKYLNSKNKKCNLSYYSLKEVDLTNIGGVNTKTLSSFNKTEFDKVIISGGDVLSVDIGSLYIDLSKNSFEVFFKKSVRKFIGKEALNKIAIKALKINNIYPWIIEGNNVYYNAVGGTGLSLLDNNLKGEIKRRLSHSAYLSLRDEFSAKQTSCSNIFPDSAMILSDYFPNNILKKKCAKDIYYFAENTKYIIFQINYRSFSSNKDIILKQLEKVSKKYKILLLPIGFAKDHDDLLALKEIKAKVENTVLFEKLNIYEITFLISNSMLFIGSSLHGNIISMSYGKPHIGLNKNIIKLDNFLKTWERTGINHCINYNEIIAAIEKSINLDLKELNANSTYLKKLVYKNFEKIFGDLDE